MAILGLFSSIACNRKTIWIIASVRPLRELSDDVLYDQIALSEWAVVWGASDFRPSSPCISSAPVNKLGVNHVASYISVKIGTIPTGAMVLGVNMPDHQLAMSTLKEMIAVSFYFSVF